MWVAIAVFALLSLFINFVFPGPVRTFVQTLVDKPLSTGLVGMLVLLLIGPVSVVLAVTVIGLALIPFLWFAVLVGGLLGSVGVARWIGSRVLAEESPDRRQEAARSLLIGMGPDHSGLHGAGSRFRRLVPVQPSWRWERPRLPSSRV